MSDNLKVRVCFISCILLIVLVIAASIAAMKFQKRMSNFGINGRNEKPVESADSIMFDKLWNISITSNHR